MDQADDLSAFIKINGFCSRNCQDYLLASMLFCSERGTPHRMPVTSSPDVFSFPPWILPEFFNNELLPGEISRSWIFQHNNVPAHLPMMATNHRWHPEECYHLTMNGNLVYTRQFRLRYDRDHRHDVGEVCQCPHIFNTQICRGWKLFRYSFGQSMLFCLVFKLDNLPARPRPERVKINPAYFEGKRNDIERPLKKGKMVLGSEGQCMPALGSGHGVSAGLGNEKSFIPLEYKSTLYEHMVDNALNTFSFQAALGEGGQLYGKILHGFCWTYSQRDPYKTVICPAVVCGQSSINPSGKIESISVRRREEGLTEMPWFRKDDYPEKCLPHIKIPFKKDDTDLNLPSKQSMEFDAPYEFDVRSLIVALEEGGKVDGKKVQAQRDPYKTVICPAVVCGQSSITPSGKIGSTFVRRREEVGLTEVLWFQKDDYPEKCLP